MVIVHHFILIHCKIKLMQSFSYKYAAPMAQVAASGPENMHIHSYKYANRS